MAKLFGINGEELGGDGASGEPEPVLSEEQTQILMLAQAAGHKVRGLPFPTDAEIDAFIKWCTDAKIKAMTLQGMLTGNMAGCYQMGWDHPRFGIIEQVNDGNIQQQDTNGEDQGAAGEE